MTGACLAVACAGPGENLPEPVEVVPPGAETPAGPPAGIERITPVLVVDAIEPVVPFWEALGFEAINPSRADGRLMFIALAKDGLEVHYQTRTRVDRSMAGGAPGLRDSEALVYLAVDDLDAIIARLGGAELVVPRRRTDWGADEIFVREPGGHVIGFAAFGGR